MTAPVDKLITIREVCKELPSGLSLLHDGHHLWPSLYRPENESLTDMVQHSLQAVMGKVTH